MKRVLSTYTNPEGVLVTVYMTYKPRSEERTWRGGHAKFSIANLGAKSTSLRSAGLSKAKC